MTNFNFDEMSVEQLGQLVETLIAKAVKWGRTNQAMPYRVFMMKIVDWFESHIQKLDFANLDFREKTLIKKIESIVKNQLWLEKEDVWDTIGKTKKTDHIEKLVRSNYGWTSEQCVFCQNKRYQDSINHQHDCPIPKLESLVRGIDVEELKSFVPIRKLKRGNAKRCEITPLFPEIVCGNNGNGKSSTKFESFSIIK